MELPEPSTVDVKLRTYHITATNSELGQLLRDLAAELEASQDNMTLLSLYVGCNPDQDTGWDVDVVIEYP